MKIQIITRNLKWRGTLTPLPLENVENIIIHHTESLVGTVEQVHQWHLNNGWAGIGYNEYITKNGNVYIGRGDNVGAHCAEGINNYNFNSYGICCEGNYEVEKDMPTAQYQSLVERIKLHKLRFRNLKRIDGHRVFTSTACPGKYFPLEKLKKSVMSNMPTLRIGSKNESVKYLQLSLNRIGNYGLLPDGDFGAKTDAAVKDFQRKNFLAVDGIVGTFTWSLLL
jgi:hypothetical protein